jgi:DNA-binding transcriptional MerR regulator
MAFLDQQTAITITQRTLEKMFSRDTVRKIVERMSQEYIDTLGKKGRVSMYVHKVPIIRNVDKLRQLMADKWLRRTQFEPEVQASKPFRKPKITYVEVEPDAEMVSWLEQWVISFHKYYENWKECIKKINEVVNVQEMKESEERIRDVERSMINYLRELGVPESTIQDLLPELRKGKATINEISKALSKTIEEVEEEEEVEKEFGEGETEQKEEKMAEKKPLIKAGAPPLEFTTMLRIATEMPAHANLKDKKWEMILFGMPLFSIPAYNTPYMGSIPTQKQQRIINDIVKFTREGKKVYLVSEWVDEIEYLAQELKKHGVNTYIITGGVDISKRQAVLDAYKEDKQGVLCGTRGVLDVGLNIPEADVCIMTTPTWNWSDANQVIGRMLRPKSAETTKEVRIYLLKDSVDKYVKFYMELKKESMESTEDLIYNAGELEFVSFSVFVDAMVEEMIAGIQKKRERSETGGA